LQDKEIFKKLKQRYVYLEQQGYEVLYIALQGSQNYELAIYTDEYKSDIDCVAVILPSFEDIINSKPEVSTTIVLENNEHIAVKDIRQMFKLFQKQNVQFLETVYTKYRIVNKLYKEEVDELLSMGDDLIHINRNALYNNIIGIAIQKDVAFKKKYPNTEKDIDKFGYSCKSLYHQIRINDFISKISKGVSFNIAMIVDDPDVKEKCLDAKLGRYSETNASMLNTLYLEDTMRYKEKVYYDEADNIRIVRELNRIKSNILKKRFQEQLNVNQSDEYKLCPDHYKNVFVTSDTHFGHSNIIGYEHRDEKMGIAGGVMTHDEQLINNWNRVVGRNDLVLILGDFSFHKAEPTMEILKKLNGDKVLIEGNHDCIYLENKKFDKTLFKAIYDYKETTYRGTKIVLMHYPIQDFKHSNKDTNPYIHLFGHIHSAKITIPRHSYNVGVDVNNFTPIKIEYAIEKALGNNGNLINGEF
jgi:calcineurin-like phosphoesterase family protein